MLNQALSTTLFSLSNLSNHFGKSNLLVVNKIAVNFLIVNTVAVYQTILVKFIHSAYIKTNIVL